jgi:hypothetical protein
MSRKSAATSWYDLMEILQNWDSGGDDDNAFEFKPRTSQSEKAWQEIKDFEDHEFNLEEYNYRLSDLPVLRLIDGEVQGEDGETITEDEARLVVKLCRKARRTKKAISLPQNDDEEGDNDGLDSFSLDITAAGNVQIGCQYYQWSDIEAFCKRYGWKA